MVVQLDEAAIHTKLEQVQHTRHRVLAPAEEDDEPVVLAQVRQMEFLKDVGCLGQDCQIGRGKAGRIEHMGLTRQPFRSASADPG